MLKPMPSPNGTNYEKLYVLQGRGAPSNSGAAYDSRGGYGPRTAAEGARYGQQLARRLLGGRQTLAYDEAPAPEAARGSSDAVSKIAEWAQLNLGPQEIDELVAALGRDRADIGAMDARRRAPSRAMSSSASKSYAEMFPGASRIKY